MKNRTMSSEVIYESQKSTQVSNLHLVATHLTKCEGKRSWKAEVTSVLISWSDNKNVYVEKHIVSSLNTQQRIFADI